MPLPRARGRARQGVASPPGVGPALVGQHEPGRRIDESGQSRRSTVAERPGWQPNDERATLPKQDTTKEPVASVRVRSDRTSPFDGCPTGL